MRSVGERGCALSKPTGGRLFGVRKLASAFEGLQSGGKPPHSKETQRHVGPQTLDPRPHPIVLAISRATWPVEAQSLLSHDRSFTLA